MLFKKGNDIPKSTWLIWAWDSIVIIAGTFLYSLSVVLFTAPNQIAPGGVSGIATLINYLMPWANIGIVSLIINIPLMIFGFVKLGKEFMIKTGISLVFFTIFTDYVLAKIPAYTGNMLLAAVFGGVLMGLGIGLVFWRTGSTGGSDIVVKILQKAIPHVKLGVISFVIDATVIIAAAFVYGTLEAALYALICVYASSKCINLVMYGFDVSKTLIIISDAADEISQAILHSFDRGATLVDGKGAYTKEKRPFIICAVTQGEYVQLTRLVKKIDPKAFVIVMTSGEVVGEGFKESLED